MKLIQGRRFLRLSILQWMSQLLAVGAAIAGGVRGEFGFAAVPIIYNGFLLFELGLRGFQRTAHDLVSRESFSSIRRILSRLGLPKTDEDRAYARFQSQPELFNTLFDFGIAVLMCGVFVAALTK